MTEAPALDAAKARVLALGWLARREHTRVELADKLRRKGCDAAIAEEVLARLVGERLISDERFAEVLVRSRRERGYGPLRIAKELEEKGVAQEAIDRWVDARSRDWIAQANRVRVKKFGARVPKPYAERVRQMRFLKYRGFTFDQIQQALGASENDAS